MNRRDALRTGVGVALGPLVGRARAATGDGGYAPLGRVAVDGATEAVVGDEGRTVYVAATDGFATVDVSDAADPRVLAERRDLFADRDGGPLGQIHDVKVDGGRLLVVGPAHPRPAEELRGAALYDVSDPADPALVGFHGTEFPIHNAFLRDGVAYLTGNDGERNALVTVDAGEEPRELGRWSLVDVDRAWERVDPRLRVCHDVYVRGDRAYLAHWDAGTWVIDVADPANPVAAAHHAEQSVDDLLAVEDAAAASRRLPGNAHYAAVDDGGTLLAVGREAWDLAGDESSGLGGIDLYDADGLSRVGHVAAPPSPDPTPDGLWTTAHNFDLRGGFLYSSWYGGGVRVHDVRDPSSARELAAWRDADAAWFWTAQRAASCVVASSFRGDVGLFTFPDPASEATTATATARSTDGDGRSAREAASAGEAGTTTGATASDGVPGFGVAAGLLGAGVGVGARLLASWSRRRR